MPAKLTIKDFIKRSNKVHKNKYNYGEAKYTGSNFKITVTCPKHGEFSLNAKDHLRAVGCRECQYDKTRSTVKYFVDKANKIHNNKYDYSKIEYKNAHTPIIIGCPIHGDSTQLPHCHFKGTGCRECGKKNRIDKTTFTTSSFIEKAIEVHGDKYLYDKVKYKHSKSKVMIGCKTHGYFKQSSNSHLRGAECRTCGTLDTRKDTSDFIRRAIVKHGDKYDYSEAVYIKNKHKVKIICPVHGMFEQSPIGHMGGAGCRKCYNDRKCHTTEQFIEKAEKVHGDRYDYSKVIYTGSIKKVTIICSKHGDFKQRAGVHLCDHGCPGCNNSKGEEKVSEYLDINNIKYVREFKFPSSLYRYDFYLPDLNIMIEYDGRQHHEPVKFWRGDKGLATNKERDRIKNILCVVNNVPLIRIPYWEYEDLENRLKIKISRIYRYIIELDGKETLYFKTFLDLARHYKLPGDATTKNYLDYIF